jgi:hypothetical protein
MKAKDLTLGLPHASGWILLHLLFFLASLFVFGSCQGSTPQPGDDDLGSYGGVPGESIRGAVESPRPGSILPPQFTVSGWAIDAWRESRGPGFEGVSVHQDDCSESTELTEAEYGAKRPDVDEVMQLDASYVTSGFNARVGPLDSGNHVLVVCAQDSRGQVFEVASVAVSVSLNMVGIDLRDSQFVSLPFTVSGWAVAHLSERPPGVEVVRIMRDSCDSDEILAEAHLNRPREDVVTGLTLTQEYLRSGFAARVTSGLPHGRQTIAVCATRVDTGDAFSMTRNVYVTEPQQQVGIFQPASDAKEASPLRVAGWAVDYSRGLGEGSGVARVEIWRGPCEVGDLLATVHVGEPTPGVRDELGLDVSYTNLGFAAVVRDLESGQHTLTVCAFSAATATYFGRTLRITIVGNQTQH